MGSPNIPCVVKAIDKAINRSHSIAVMSMLRARVISSAQSAQSASILDTFLHRATSSIDWSFCVKINLLCWSSDLFLLSVANSFRHVLNTNLRNFLRFQTIKLLLPGLKLSSFNNLIHRIVCASTELIFDCTWTTHSGNGKVCLDFPSEQHLSWLAFSTIAPI